MASDFVQRRLKVLNAQTANDNTADNGFIDRRMKALGLTPVIEPIQQRAKAYGEAAAQKSIIPTVKPNTLTSPISAAQSQRGAEVMRNQATVINLIKNQKAAGNTVSDMYKAVGIKIPSTSVAVPSFSLDLVQNQKNIDVASKANLLTYANNLDATKRIASQPTTVTQSENAFRTLAENIKVPEQKTLNMANPIMYSAGQVAAGVGSGATEGGNFLVNAVNDALTGGKQSNDFRKIANYFSENPDAEKVGRTAAENALGGSSGFYDINLANKIGVPVATLKRYRESTKKDTFLKFNDQTVGATTPAWYKTYAGQALYSAGQMLMSQAMPSIGNTGGFIGALASKATPSKAITALLKPSPFTMNMSLDSAGQKYTDLAKEYGSRPANFINALATGYAEALTENIGGFTDSKTITNLFKSGKFKENVFKWLLNSADEGLEEVVNVPLTGAIDKLTVDHDKKIVGTGGIFDLDNMVQSGVQGALMGALLGAPAAITTTTEAVQQNHNIKTGIDSITAIAKTSLPDNMRPKAPTGKTLQDYQNYSNAVKTQVEAYKKQVLNQIAQNTAKTAQTSNVANVTGTNVNAAQPSATARKTVADLSLFNSSVLSNLNQARKNLISYAQSHFPKTVVNQSTNMKIDISRNGLDKLLSGNIPEEKYASAFHVPELVSNALQVGSAENVKGKTGINSYYYFDSPIEIGKENYTAHIRVRSTDMGNKYYGHTLSGVVDDIKIEPSARGSAAEAALHSVNTLGSNNIIPNSAPKINTQQRIIMPGLSTKANNGVEPKINTHVSKKSITDDKDVKAFLDEIEQGAPATYDYIPEDVAKLLTSSGISGSKDISRNLDAASGGNARIRKVLQDTIEKPFYAAKDAYSKDVKQELDNLYKAIKEYGFKVGSKESAAIQRYGEGQYVDTVGETHSYTLADLKREFPNSWQGMVEVEKYIRKTYDQYIEKVNKSLELIYPNPEFKLRQEISRHEALIATYKDQIAALQKSKTPENTIDAEKQIASTLANLNREQGMLKSKNELLQSGDFLRNKRLLPRKDYFHHFNEMEQGFGGLKNILKTSNDIDPHLVGISEFTKPKSKFAGWLQKRNGGAFTEDAIGGLLKYIPSAEYKIHIDPVIARNRGVIRSLVESTAETRNANGLISQLTDWTNDLAGKTNPIDRTLLRNEHRKLMAVVQWLNNRYKGNAVLGNFSSAVSQFYNLPNATAYVKNPISWSKGVRDYATNIAESFGAKGNATELIDQSAFIRERFLDKSIEQFNEGILKAPRKFATWMLTFGDEQASKMIWYSAYEDGMSKNVMDPIAYADDITRRSVAGRGIGEMPITQKSKLVQLVMPFQVEVNNSWQLFKERSKDKDALGLFLMAISAWLMNNVSEALIGRRILPDIIDAINNSFQSGIDPNSKDSTSKKMFNGFGRIGGEAVSAIPGGAFAASLLLTDNQNKALFGESDPTRFGTGIAGITNLVKPFSQAVSGQNVDLLSPTLNTLMPFGGKQTERIISAAEDMGMPSVKLNINNGVTVSKNPFPASYTDSGNLRFAIGNNPVDIAKDFAFGPYSTSEGKKYINNGLKPLSDNDTSLAGNATKQGIESTAYVNLLRKLNAAKNNDEKRDILSESDLTNKQKTWMDNSFIDQSKTKKNVDYTSLESITTSLMSDSKKEKYLAAKAAGYTLQAFDIYYNILHKPGNKETRINALMTMGVTRQQAEKIWGIMY